MGVYIPTSSEFFSQYEEGGYCLYPWVIDTCGGECFDTDIVLNAFHTRNIVGEECESCGVTHLIFEGEELLIIMISNFDPKYSHEGGRGLKSHCICNTWSQIISERWRLRILYAGATFQPE